MVIQPWMADSTSPVGSGARMATMATAAMRISEGQKTAGAMVPAPTRTPCRLSFSVISSSESFSWIRAEGGTCSRPSSETGAVVVDVGGSSAGIVGSWSELDMIASLGQTMDSVAGSGTVVRVVGSQPPFRKGMD
ncbi:hypothetical protein ACFFX0_01865 [Citricoccus parietis]|uniref:Uncharacterized protein n=1 Tax=Citricoccus parietis TaxID=592307 RepID=A0ABV5FTJ1_9MICC